MNLNSPFVLSLVVVGLPGNGVGCTWVERRLSAAAAVLLVVVVGTTNATFKRQLVRC